MTKYTSMFMLISVITSSHLFGQYRSVRTLIGATYGYSNLQAPEENESHLNYGGFATLKTLAGVQFSGRITVTYEFTSSIREFIDYDNSMPGYKEKNHSTFHMHALKAKINTDQKAIPKVKHYVTLGVASMSFSQEVGPGADGDALAMLCGLGMDKKLTPVVTWNLIEASVVLNAGGLGDFGSFGCYFQTGMILHMNIKKH